MEKGDPEPEGEGRPEDAPPDERAALRYEEDITALLVTVARLHGRIERLQRKEDREEDEFSDLCSEYTASLPRCPAPLPSLAAVPPPPPRPEERHPDLFLAVKQAVASLEKTVFSHQSRVPGVGAEAEGPPPGAEDFEERLKKSQRGRKELFLRPGDVPAGSVWGFLSGDWSIFEQEIALLRERNAALRGELQSRAEELGQAQGTLRAYREERDRLQGKVKDLRDALSKVETLQGGASSLLSERDFWGFQDPVAVAAQEFLRCFQGAASVHPTPGLFSPKTPLPAETHLGDPQGAQREQLHRALGTSQGLHRLLLGALREAKSRTESLSVLLALSESDDTALRLAVQYSERCLEACEALFSLTTQTAVEEGGPPCTGNPNDVPPGVRSAVTEKARRFLQSRSTDGETPGGCGVRSEQSPAEPGEMVEEDERKVLRDYIRRLRAERGSLKLPARRPPPGPDAVAAEIHSEIEAQVAEVREALRGALPSQTTPPKTGKAHLLQELPAAREALAELNTRLHLAEKDKRRLELQTYTCRAQEDACLLMVRILQAERDELCGQRSSSSSSSGRSASSGDSEDYGPAVRSKRKIIPGLLEDPSGAGPGPDPEGQALALRDLLARNRELKDQVRSLLVDLEEQSQERRAQEAQETELTRDFFKAHSALVPAYRNARKKQEAQVRQLESQMTLMSQRQARRLQSLIRTLRRLEGKAGNPAEVPRVGQAL